MNALELLASLHARGVRFMLDDAAGRVRVHDPDRTVSDDERGRVRALKGQIRALLLQRLPDHRGEHACEGFDAAPGAALCERCAYGLPDHFWRRSGDCVFFAGAPTEATCRRCGVQRLEHLGAAAAPKTEAT